MLFVLFGEYVQFCLKRKKKKQKANVLCAWDSFEKKPHSDRLRTGAQSKALLSLYNYTEAKRVYGEKKEKKRLPANAEKDI